MAKDIDSTVEWNQSLIRDLAIPKQIEYKEPADELRQAEPERFAQTTFYPDIEDDEWMKNQLAGLNPENPESPTNNEPDFN